MSFGSTVPPLTILEPIIKAQLEKKPFLNLGGFILGYGIDTTLFGMMLIMLVDWWKYAPKESRTIKAVLVNLVYARWASRDSWKYLKTDMCDPASLSSGLLCLCGMRRHGV